VLTKLFSSGWTWVAVTFVLLVGVFAFEATHQEVMDSHLNASIWIITNLILFFGYAALLFYVVVYGLFFDWVYLPGTKRPNIGGRLIFSLTASLAGIVAMQILLIFFAPASGRPWYIAPPEMVFWVPTARFIVLAAVTAVFFTMSGTLVKRIISGAALNVSVEPRQVREPGVD
jgi:hypothetical protein